MDTRPYPSEEFLAHSLRNRPSWFFSFFKRLLAGLGLLAAVAFIFFLLAGYVYLCFEVQGAGPAKGAKTEAPKTDREKLEAAAAGTEYVWVQLMPDGKSGTPGGRLVRTIGPQGGTCPTIAQGGDTFPMHQRVTATRAAFPILLCEFVLIENSAARIGSTLLPVRADEPNDIIVLGDTGCRMVYWQIQPCRVAADWPFAKVAESASREAVIGKSFILHVGDFHYRENPCIDSSTECGTSPFGDSWETWRAEFFEPAKRLLLAAPWVIMRGNHEDCARAGAGWIFLFALPGQYETGSACNGDAQMYQINIGKTDEERARPRILVVMDSSDEKNEHYVKENCKQYRKLLKTLKAEEPGRSTREVWLAMHQPLWGRSMNGEQQLSMNGLQEEQDANGNPKDGEAVECVNGETRSALPVFREKFEMAKDKRIARLLLAGDTHAFQFFWPENGWRPIQIIAGNGGTKLDTLYPLLPEGTKAPDKKPDPDTSDPIVNKVRSWGVAGQNLTLMQHGFTVMQRVETMWTATQFDREGKKTAACQFSEALASTTSDLTNCNEIRVRQASSG
jgi:hypothetical protein